MYIILLERQDIHSKCWQINEMTADVMVNVVQDNQNIALIVVCMESGSYSM